MFPAFPIVHKLSYFIHPPASGVTTATLPSGALTSAMAGGGTPGIEAIDSAATWAAETNSVFKKE